MVEAQAPPISSSGNRRTQVPDSHQNELSLDSVISLIEKIKGSLGRPENLSGIKKNAWQVLNMLSNILNNKNNKDTINGLGNNKQPFLNVMVHTVARVVAVLELSGVQMNLDSISVPNNFKNAVTRNRSLLSPGLNQGSEDKAGNNNFDGFLELFRIENRLKQLENTLDYARNNPKSARKVIMDYVYFSSVVPRISASVRVGATPSNQQPQPGGISDGAQTDSSRRPATVTRESQVVLNGGIIKVNDNDDITKIAQLISTSNVSFVGYHRTNNGEMLIIQQNNRNIGIEFKSLGPSVVDLIYKLLETVEQILRSSNDKNNPNQQISGAFTSDLMLTLSLNAHHLIRNTLDFIEKLGNSCIKDYSRSNIKQRVDTLRNTLQSLLNQSTTPVRNQRDSDRSQVPTLLTQRVSEVLNQNQELRISFTLKKDNHRHVITLIARKSQNGSYELSISLPPGLEINQNSLKQKLGELQNMINNPPDRVQGLTVQKLAENFHKILSDLASQEINTYLPDLTRMDANDLRNSNTPQFFVNFEINPQSSRDRSSSRPSSSGFSVESGYAVQVVSIADLTFRQNQSNNQQVIIPFKSLLDKPSGEAKITISLEFPINDNNVIPIDLTITKDQLGKLTVSISCSKRRLSYEEINQIRDSLSRITDQEGNFLFKIEAYQLILNTESVKIQNLTNQQIHQRFTSYNDFLNPSNIKYEETTHTASWRVMEQNNPPNLIPNQQVTKSQNS
ncbi:MAG: hypothetical protein N3E37_02540 [Candidatus Micrarchaeota archaeon]|nr:hypothetical protein [Candidatus Micrarchaeota archaeon]